jgi:hypothetical protein
MTRERTFAAERCFAAKKMRGQRGRNAKSPANGPRIASGSEFFFGSDSRGELISGPCLRVLSTPGAHGRSDMRVPLKQQAKLGRAI